MAPLNLTSLFPTCTLYPGNPFYISPIKKGCNNPSGYCNRAIIVYIFLRPLILRPCISTSLPTYSNIFNTLSQYHISLVPSTNFYKQVAFCKIIRNKWHIIEWYRKQLLFKTISIIVLRNLNSTFILIVI